MSDLFTLTWMPDAGAQTITLDEITVDSLLRAAGDLGVSTYTWSDIHVYRLVATLAGGLLSHGEGIAVCPQGTVTVRRE